MLPWTEVRTVILVTGWPVLAVASGWMLVQAWRFRHRLEGSAAGGLVVQSVLAWVVASTLLGTAVSAMMVAQVEDGVRIGIPIFIAWLVSLAMMVHTSRGWSQEARAIREYYRGRGAVDRLKASIINRFSHAFATPLTPMANEIALLRSGRIGDINDRQAHALEVLARNQERLRGVIQEAVLAGEVHGRRIPLAASPVDLSELVHHCVSRALGEGDRRITVNIPSMQALGDQERLQYVFEHILRHAARGPAGRVTVEGRTYRDEVEVTIHYPSEEDPIAAFGLLDDADTVDAPSADTLELGLFTARGLVELHGGSLQVGRDENDVMIAIRLPVPRDQVERSSPRLAKRA